MWNQRFNIELSGLLSNSFLALVLLVQVLDVEDVGARGQLVFSARR